MTATLTKHTEPTLDTLPAALRQEIAQMCEKAYRRGFHHGFQVASGYYTQVPVPTEAEVKAWRFKDAAEAEIAPGLPQAGEKFALVE